MLTAVCMAGPNSIAILQIRDLTKAVDQVVRVSESLQLPVPAGMIQGQVGMLVMAPDFSGIDTAQPITLYVEKFSLEQNDPPAIVARFSIKDDGAEYLAAVERMAPVREEVAPGITKFVMGDPADAEAPSFFVIVKESQALTGQKLESIKALAGDMSEQEKGVMAALPGEISASINVAAVSDLITDQVKQQKAMIEMYKTQMEAEGMDTSELFQNDPTAGLDAMTDMMSAVFAQLDLLVLNLDMSGDVTLRTHMQPTPNSTLAAILEETAPPSTVISGHRDPNSIFSGFGTMKGMDRIIEPYAEWVASMYKQMGPPMDDFADGYKQMMLGMKGVYSGGFSMVIKPPLPDAPFQMSGLYEIADKAKAKQSMLDMMKMQEEQGKSMTNVPYNISISSVTEEPHKDVEIVTFTISYDFTDEAAGEMVPESISKLFSGITYSVAFMDQYLAFSFGSLESLHQVIDYALGEGAPVPHRPGFADIAEEAVGYWNLNIAGVINAVAALMPPEMAGPLSAVQGIEASVRGLSVKELDGFSSMVRLTEADLQGFMQIGMSLAPKGGPGLAPPADDGMMMFDEEMESEDVEPASDM
jgi:hypothetical protein